MMLRKNIKRKKKAQASQDAATTKAAAPKKRRRISLSTLIPIIFMVVGACVVAYPTFSDWWNSYHQSRAIATYVNAVEETDPEVIDRMFEEAHAYNQRLLSKPNRYTMTDADKAEYESILDLTGTGVIGYIQINCIGVNLPIYHGVAESVLQVAIGHIEGTSLPVGGPTTHAAISGHRGLPSAKLFTDLDKLVEGDTFTITVLNQTLTYQVDQIRIVEPQDLSDLNFYQDQDYVTLITCTPYGINTHRMLVRGHRIDNISGAIAIPAEAVQIPNYIAIPAVGIPMLFVFLVGMLLYYRFKGAPLDHDKALKAVRASEEMKHAEAAAARAEAAAEAARQDVAQAEPEAEAEAEPEAEEAPEGEAEVEAAAVAAGETEAADEAEGEPEAEVEAEAESEAEAEVELEVAEETEAEDEPEVEPEVTDEPETEAEPEPELEPEATAEPDPDPDPEVATDPDADPDTVSEQAQTLENDSEVSIIADRSDNFDNDASLGESGDTVEAGGLSEDAMSEDMRDTEVEDEQ